LIINNANKVIDKHLVCKGTSNMLTVTPADILRPVLMTGGNSIILAHNHPSGDVSPSHEDITFTAKIKKACNIMAINLLDHLVYSSDNYYSFKKEGIL
jgi:DNA repair protein RadC